jgi:hypothetical protein
LTNSCGAVTLARKQKIGDQVPVNFKKRIQALERRVLCERVTLFFENGSSARISDRADYILGVF